MPTMTTCTPNAAGICQTDHSTQTSPSWREHPIPGKRGEYTRHGVPVTEAQGG